MTSSSPELLRSIKTLNVPGIAIAHRAIRDEDELELLPGEREAFACGVLKVRRASGAARSLARGLLSGFGEPQAVIARSASGAPVWPKGLVGSLAHDAAIAVAAVAKRRDFLGLGIDVEPAEPFDPAMLDMIATPRERQQIGGDLDRARLLFCLKEAVYKAVYPLDQTFLEHHDVAVDFDRGVAVVCGGRWVQVRHGRADHIIALAFIRAAV